MYLGGIDKAQILESAAIKFADTPQKDFTATFTCTRDSGTSQTIEKIIYGDDRVFPKSIYIHAYCDRFKAAFSDLTNTASPEFISYALATRPAGPSRDK